MAGGHRLGGGAGRHLRLGGRLQGPVQGHLQPAGHRVHNRHASAGREVPGRRQTTGIHRVLTESGKITDPAVKQRIEALATEVKQIPSVGTVETPYIPFATEKGLESKDGTVGRVNVVFEGGSATPPMADIKALISDVEATNSNGLTVGVGGQVVDFASSEPPKSEGVGILVAIVIMLVMFGAVVAAGLPILTALIGLGAGLSLVTVAARFMDIATFGPTLAAMIGLGVGIDYALFVINRYRQAVHVGREPREAALESVNTAGRAVVFAGTTVVIALGGLFVLGIGFMNGLAVGAAITVIMVMLTAVTLLPAVISLLGHKVFAWPSVGQEGEPARGRDAVALCTRTAVEALDLRHRGARPDAGAVGAGAFDAARLPDASGKPEGNTTRIAYDLTSKGFGPGANGPFLVVVELPKAGDVAPANELSKALAATPGVASSSPVVPGTPSVAADKSAAIVQVIPTTGPQDKATSDPAGRDPRHHHSKGRAVDGDDRLRRRCDRGDGRLHHRAGAGVAELPGGCGRPGIPGADGAVPVVGGAAYGRTHLPAEPGCSAGCRSRGLPVGQPGEPVRRHGDWTHPAVPSGDAVRDPVRAFDGLPGVPGVADAGGGRARKTTGPRCDAA